jgi:hypothetical protein
MGQFPKDVYNKSFNTHTQLYNPLDGKIVSREKPILVSLKQTS